MNAMMGAHARWAKLRPECRHGKRFPALCTGKRMLRLLHFNAESSAQRNGGSMRFQFNKKAATVFARDLRIMAHAMFVMVSGLSAWKNTWAGAVAGLLVWFALQAIALFIASLETAQQNACNGGD
jgi:uncharacterized membrane protein YagU involved in acid resistance